jgi:hypothetical protein
MAGGWFVVRAGFRLPSKGRAVVGAALGLVLATWLANLLSHWILPPVSFWISALIVLAAGLGLHWRSGGREAFVDDLRPWLLGAAIVLAAIVLHRQRCRSSTTETRSLMAGRTCRAAEPNFLFPTLWQLFERWSCAWQPVVGAFTASGTPGAGRHSRRLAAASRKWVRDLDRGVIFLASGAGCCSSRGLYGQAKTPPVGSAAQSAHLALLRSLWAVEGGATRCPLRSSTAFPAVRALYQTGLADN